MNSSIKRKIAIIDGLALIGYVIFGLARHPANAPKTTGGESKDSPTHRASARPKTGNGLASGPHEVTPYIVADTVTDSPGTNLETRVVTFSAEIGGTAPVFQQWKVDKGGGFLPVAGSATNATLIITNAHLTDTGLYALFATNSAGGISTTPVPLVVVEGAD